MIRVLIVDDEFIMRQGLRYMIDWEKEGYEIVGEASNGNDAFQLIQEVQPHIIFSDIVMPLMDGVDFTVAVHHLFPEIQMIILSGYDNFEYVKQTFINGVVDYILKPTLNPNELRSVLSKAVARIPSLSVYPKESVIGLEAQIERYLLGIDEKLNVNLFQREMMSSYYCFYVVYVPNECGRDMFDLLYKKIGRVLSAMECTHKALVTIRDKETQICVLFGFEMSERSGIKVRMEKLSSQLALVYNRLFSVISRTFGQIQNMKKVYLDDIIPNYDMGFYFKGRYLLDLEQENPVRTVKMSKFDFTAYNRFIVGMQYSDALRLLAEYHEDLLRCRMDSYKMKNQMKNLIYIFLDAMPLRESEKENYRRQFFKWVEQAYYESEYRKGMDDIFDMLMEMSCKAFPKKNRRMNKILNYIEENYQEDLRLEMLSEEFNYNYHYLSSFFNQEMKEGFSDYLNRVRIRKACEMLENPSKSISEISNDVGYSEHSYFCRVFKKYTGKTPSVWRRDKNEEQNGR